MITVGRFFVITEEPSFRYMVSATYKNRTRDEILAAFRESIRRKHEWQKRAKEEIEIIRQERLQLSL